MTDEEIIRAICSTPSEQNRALEQLYRYKGAEFKRFFHYKGVPLSLCEDVLQDAILKVFNGAKDFRGSGGFSGNSANAWMWAIARNSMNDHLQRRYKDTIVIGGSLNDSDWSVSHQEELKDGESSLIQDGSVRKTQLEIDFCVSKGMEDFCAEHPDRALVLLMQMDGESIESIARRIERTSAATKQYISQCKIRLKPFIGHCLAFVTGKNYEE